MRKPLFSLDEVKNNILALKGKNIEMKINKGRKKIIEYEGVIENIYNSVFVVRVDKQPNIDKLSLSFSDVLCGDVKIALKK